MPAPTTRAELLSLVREARAQLEARVAEMSEAELLAAQPGQWSLKDTLAHIAAWQRYACDQFAAAIQNQTPFRVAGEADVHSFNAQVYERFRDTPLSDVLAEYRAAHADLIAWLDRLSDNLLFDPASVPWNHGRTLAWTVGANTFWHYEEHPEVLAARPASPGPGSTPS